MENTKISHRMDAGLRPDLQAGSGPGARSFDAAPRTLREAAAEFESLFVSHLFQAMRRTVPETGWMGSGEGEQVFREMLDQEMSRRVAEKGSFGIGELLCRQLGGAEEEGEQP
jgi:peptidoglycan hydrolase FlgJ